MIEEAPRAPDSHDRGMLLDVLARAFRDNPMNRALHGPDPRHRVRANRAGLRAIVLDSSEWVESSIIVDNDRVIGGILALPPSVRQVPSPSFRRQIGCFLHQGARAMDGWGQVSATLSPLRPTRPHWYLAVLGVEPARQGQGTGGRLLDALFARIETERAPLYLECDREDSLRFYQRRGFEIVHEVEVHGVRCWGLSWGNASENQDLCDPVRQA